LTESSNKIKELDGRQLYLSFLAGAQRIFDNQKLLNKINVFPVADADTGTNLASTMRSIMEAIIPAGNPKETAVALADAAITGARGNSGIIFAQFLYGFSNEIKTSETLDIRSFAESMKNAVSYAYEAIANPVEGTILTVIREWADYLYSLKDIIDDFIKLLIEALEKAQQSLSETTQKLEVLARTHVVDAGAKGFVVWLEGILDFLSGKSKDMSQLAGNAVPAGEVDTEGMHEEITFRYCAETLISGKNLDKKQIQAAILHCGDSLVIAGSPLKMRIHMHSDHPSELFSIIKKYGDIVSQKVDDMVMQNEVRCNRKSPVALLTDSTCDLPKEFLDRHQIHVVPLSVHFENTFFLDRVTIQPQQFYQMMQDSQLRATSAQPAFKDFQNKYEFLGTQYDSVIGINLSGKMSGTFTNSVKAAADVSARTGKKMRVFNSRSVTGGLGLVVMRAALALERGDSYEEIVAQADHWIDSLDVSVNVQTLKYIIKSGRVSPFRSFIARILDLKPVISIGKDGSTFLSGKSFSEHAALKSTIRKIGRKTQQRKVWNYAITHSDNLPAVEWLAGEMKKLTGKHPAFVEQASPVLVANIGPGVVCISILFE
jgi:DegV family protein with EDD domain